MSRVFSWELCCCNILRLGGLWPRFLLKSDNPWCRAQRCLWNRVSRKTGTEVPVKFQVSGKKGENRPVPSWWGGPRPPPQWACLWMKGPQWNERRSLAQQIMGPLSFVGFHSQVAFLTHTGSTWWQILGNQSRTRRVWMLPCLASFPSWWGNIYPEWGSSSLWNITLLIGRRLRARTQAS